MTEPLDRAMTDEEFAVVFTNAEDEARSMFMFRVSELVRRITYKKGYQLILAVDKKDEKGRLYLQVQCERPDIYTNEMGLGYGGKAYLSEHMTDSEIARLAFGLFRAYEEHECREWFQVDGVSPFGPHISLDALLKAATQLDFRS